MTDKYLGHIETEHFGTFSIRESDRAPGTGYVPPPRPDGTVNAGDEEIPAEPELVLYTDCVLDDPINQNFLKCLTVVDGRGASWKLHLPED